MLLIYGAHHVPSRVMLGMGILKLNRSQVFPMTSDSLFDRVLLLEDDESHALLIKRALSGYVNELEHSSTFAEALEALSHSEFDLIVTDLNLPDTNGLEHVGRLTAKAPPVSVIVLTSSNLLEDAVGAMKLGARDFIVKNFNADFKENLFFALSRVHALNELEREKRILEQQMRVLRSAIENSNDGLAVIASSGEVLYRNNAFLNFMQDCGGRGDNFFEAFGSQVAKVETLLDNIRRIFGELTGGGVWSSEVLFSQNQQLAYDLSLSAIVNDHNVQFGEAGEFVAWVRNISERKQREKFQRDILSTTTHDLKGPLGAIIISTDLLGDMLKEQKRANELVLRINSSAQTAVNLIDEFLSARRIQEGTFILRPTRQNVSELTDEVLADYQTISLAKGILLKSDLGEEPIECIIDRLGFVRILGNLLSNAFKFTPRGGNVSVNLKPVAHGFYLIVADNGCGMEPAEVQGIFDRFTRLDKHAGTHGSGLGLYVVRAIVNAHAGEISVTSQAGHGTKFEIFFPEKPPVNSHGELIALDFT